MNNQRRTKSFLLILALAILTTPVFAQSLQQVQARIDSLNKQYKETYYTDPELAIKLVNEAMALSIKYGYTFGEACAHSNFGTNYFKEGKNTKAIEECFTALRLFETDEKYKNTTEYGMVFIRLAAALNVENDYTRSLAYSQKAVALAHKLNNREFLAIAYETLGNSYYLGLQSDSALHYFTIAKANFAETGSFSKIANLENNIGVIYSDKGDYNLTLAHFERALSIYREHNRYPSYVTAFTNIAEIYHRLKSYKKALNTIDSAEFYAKKYNTQGAIIGIYSIKAHVYKELGNLDSSAAYYEKIIALKDSTYNDTYKKELAALQLKSDVYKTETENKLLTKDKRIAVLYRNLAIAGIVGLVVVLAFLLLTQRIRIHRHVKNQLEEEVALRTKEIFRQKETIFHTNLRLKLALNSAKSNSHFAVNLLGTLQQVVLQKKPQEAQEQLNKLTQLLQYVLEKSPLERVSLQKELQMLEYYIQLEQIRLNNCFEYKIISTVDRSLTIPALLLQPYVANAIQQGIGPATDGPLQLELHAEVANDILTISITNNGINWRKGKQNKVHSLDKNIGQERLDLLTHLTHKNHLAVFEEIISTSGRFSGNKTVLQIPIETQPISLDSEKVDERIEFA